MPGGITSSVHRLSLRHPGGTSTQVVLKRCTDPDWDDTHAMVQNEARAHFNVLWSRGRLSALVDPEPLSRRR